MEHCLSQDLAQSRQSIHAYLNKWYRPKFYEGGEDCLLKGKKKEQLKQKNDMDREHSIETESEDTNNNVD